MDKQIEDKELYIGYYKEEVVSFGIIEKVSYIRRLVVRACLF